jgi:hypothetical protein
MSYQLTDAPPAVLPALPLAPAVDPTPGKLLEQSGRLKNLSLLTALVFGGLAAGMTAQEDTEGGTPIILVAAGGVLSLSLNIVGNSKQTKAGKLMQQQ